MSSRAGQPKRPPWRVPTTPTSLSHPPAVTGTTTDDLQRRLLLDLAARGIITAKQADEYAESFREPTLMPRFVVLRVDLSRTRREMLNDVVRLADWFRDRWTADPPRSKGGRPHSAIGDLKEITQRLDEVHRLVEQAWPDIIRNRSAGNATRILKQIMWPRPPEQQDVFKAAGLVRVVRPFCFQPEKRHLSIVEAVAIAIVNRRIRKPITCVDAIFAGLRGCDRRTIRNLRRKQPPRNKPHET